MEKRIEKWESLRLEAQKFTPQEFVAGCGYTDTYTVEEPDFLKNSSCRNNAHITCLDDGAETAFHMFKTHEITFDPTGAPSAQEFWKKAYDLVNGSANFDVYCDEHGETRLGGPVKVIGCGSDDPTVTWSEMISGHWQSGTCGMSPSGSGNSTAIAILGASYQHLLNISG